MNRKNKTEEQENAKRQLAELHVTLGLIRSAVEQMSAAMKAKDKESFNEAFKRLVAYSR